MSKQRIRKAVVPVAGYGTRFLPATKAMPKEMMPIIDKPVIQIVVEQLVEAGIEQIILVTGWHKRSIEDHFDNHLELEGRLEESGKEEVLKTIRDISNMAEFIYVRQKEQRGNGDAILCAKNIVGDEPFVVMWGDEFIDSDPVPAKQAIDLYNKYQATIFAGFETDKEEDTLKYGFAKGKEVEKGVIEVDELVEKPGPGKAPSNLAIVSTFVFPPEIFAALEKKGENLKKGEELVWLDGVNSIKNKIPAYGFNAGGKFYDCGNKLEYLKTNVEFALKNSEIKDEFRSYLKKLKKNL
jgi:UTP--glucose-1-phosphate uridylyltransferase